MKKWLLMALNVTWAMFYLSLPGIFFFQEYAWISFLFVALVALLCAVVGVYKCRKCRAPRYFTMTIGTKDTVPMKFGIFPMFSPNLPCQNCGATDDSDGVPPENIFETKT